MLKSIAWPSAIGFLLAVAAISFLNANAPPGGERLTLAGMAFIIAMGIALGAIIGALLSFLFKKD